ncbi:hypothetical protein IGI04_007375 [Brassica rapa subsp. trilocularis]|uniref:DUF4378 domain-containing protein n=1 Tax=Brassica rapa subsp. trilocularis TaxID=1813537 RepID=A0ABQ7NKT8_BRACM|nr:hypothetical protein IGI04_007375 [Brassica rapa subsp. trilocularis]
MVTCEKGDGNYEELPALDQTVEGRIRPRLDRLFSKVHMVSEPGQAGEGGTREPGDSKALVTYTAQPSLQNNRENEYLRRSDLDSLIKMLKENDILMDSNYLNMEMKHRSSTTMELEEERDGDWSRWAKRALESCGLWSSHGKGKPFMEMATEEGQTRGLKLGNEVVQGDTTKSEIEATLGKSKLVRVVEDRGVIRGLRQGEDECYQLVGRLREVWSELDVVKTHTSNPRCCQERRKQDVIFSFLMEEVCELVKYTCDVWEMNRKPERWKGGTSCKRGRLRKLSKEWLMKRRAWRKDSESEHLSDRMSVILKRIKDVLQQMVIGEFSYSAYMGETVGDSADMRGMDTKRADECVTKKEWDELVKHVYALATTRSLGAP